MKARVFGALALVAGFSAILSDNVEAAPAASRCGTAVWFADGNGLTASGERNEPGALAAAHRSLPFGTEVRVENLGNGRSVVVRVNDRGPFTKGRIISVSSAAAEKLGMKSRGVAKVRLTLVDGDNPPDDSCGALASVAAPSEGDWTPPEEEATAAEATTAVAAIAEDAVVEEAVLEETAPETAPETPIEETIDGGTVLDRMAERFEVAFQPETWQDLELKRVMEAFAPRLFAARHPEAVPQPVEPPPVEAGAAAQPVEPPPTDILFSRRLAETWPILQGQSEIDLSPAALSTSPQPQ